MFKKLLGKCIFYSHSFFGIVLFYTIFFIKNPLFLMWITFINLITLFLWPVFGGCFLIPIENYLIHNNSNYIKTYTDLTKFSSILYWKYVPVITGIICLIKFNLIN